jgi:hypothetical protein
MLNITKKYLKAQIYKPSLIERGTKAQIEYLNFAREVD